MRPILALADLMKQLHAGVNMLDARFTCPGRLVVTNETIPPDPVVDREPRCWCCGKKLAEELARPWRIRCVRRKSLNTSPAPAP